MSRYNRHIILPEIGPNGQQKINTVKVLVIGAGGLGCPILQYLAAAGVGTLGIVDFDTVDETNLQRQILFGMSTLGQNKALAAKSRLEDLNPTIQINAYPEALTKNNALDLFKQYDIIVDGSDNFETRYLINDAALITQKPVVYGAIYKFEGQVSVFNYKNGPNYRCLFPDIPNENSYANCSDVGVLGVLPGIIGTLQANEVLKVILELGDPLSGKLFCYNAKTCQSYTLNITKQNHTIISKETFLNSDYSMACNDSVPEISAESILDFDNSYFLDVRELHEQPELPLKNCVKIPLKELEANLHKLPKNKTLIVFCQSGIRSKTAITILKKHTIENCYSLIGGISTILEQLRLI